MFFFASLFARFKKSHPDEFIYEQDDDTTN